LDPYCAKEVTENKTTGIITEAFKYFIRFPS